MITSRCWRSFHPTPVATHSQYSCVNRRFLSSTNRPCSAKLLRLHNNSIKPAILKSVSMSTFSIGSSSCTMPTSSRSSTCWTNSITHLIWSAHRTTARQRSWITGQISTNWRRSRTWRAWVLASYFTTISTGSDRRKIQLALVYLCTRARRKRITSNSCALETWTWSSKQSLYRIVESLYILRIVIDVSSWLITSVMSRLAFTRLLATRPLASETSS